MNITESLTALNIGSMAREWPLKGVERCPDLWFRDGDIVLLAGRTCFRIHRAILSRRSDVFETLFRIPQPTEKVEGYTIEGCAVIPLFDSPIDLTHLLLVLYDAQRYYPENQQVDFSVIAALIRLGHKYDFPDLVDNAIVRLKTCFPTKLEEWELLGEYDHCSVKLRYDLNDIICIINLARLTNTISILPAAFYRACALDIPTIMNGVKRPDGMRDQFSPEDQARCLQAKFNVISRMGPDITDYLFRSKSHPVCDTWDDCNDKLRAICQAAHIDRLITSSDPLANRIEESAIAVDLCCILCQEILFHDNRAARRAVWKKLPMYTTIEMDHWD